MADKTVVPTNAPTPGSPIASGRRALPFETGGDEAVGTNQLHRAENGTDTPEE
jgi:hypothetical protein